MRVLDLGGTPHQWQEAPVKPKEVVVLNIEPLAAVQDTRIRPILGDACDLPEALGTEDFDLVYSNSVLEHVGGHARRQAFARTVRSAAPRYWIQTPYRYFPVEPHWLFPGFQFLPIVVRVEISLRWQLGHIRSADREAALADVCGVELVSGTEMSGLFPDSEVWRERLGGVTKSLVAIQCG